MAARLDLVDVVKMIRACAPDAVLRVATHSIVVKYGEAVEALPKGPGKPQRPEDARGEVYARVVAKACKGLGLDPDCVHRHFPDLIRESERPASVEGE